MSKLFTLGFIFTNDLSQVYLLRKLRPDWQSGLLNGIGGKFLLNAEGQVDETPYECMEREAIEECSYRGPWYYVTQIEVSGSKISLFASRVTHDVFPPIAQTDEYLYLRHINDFQDENAAKCLVPMTLKCILTARNYLEGKSMSTTTEMDLVYKGMKRIKCPTCGDRMSSPSKLILAWHPETPTVQYTFDCFDCGCQVSKITEENWAPITCEVIE